MLRSRAGSLPTEESDLKTQRKATLVAALTLFVLVCVSMQAGLFPPSGQMLGGEDVRGLFFPWVSSVRAALSAGRLPLWDASTWGGYPFFANPQVGLFYPPAWLAFLLPVRFGLGAYAAFHLWLAGMGMWLLARRLTGSEWGAVLAALILTFSGFAAARLYMGHLGLLATLAWLPWILAAYLWSVQRGDRSGTAGHHDARGGWLGGLSQPQGRGGIERYAGNRGHGQSAEYRQGAWPVYRQSG